MTCGNTFTSHETASLEDAVIVRKASPSQLEPFSRLKLFTSIYDSCKHRPTALGDAESLTNTIVGKLIAQHLIKATLERESIIQTVSQTLQHFDTIAATMYNAYHPLK